jgi:hypothetical protein
VDEKCVILRSYDKKLGFQIKKPHITARLLAPRGGLFSNQFWDELRVYATLNYLFIQVVNNREFVLILVVLAIL